MIRTQFNPETTEYNGKEMEQSIHTVPDQTLSIRDLLDRHSRGLPLGTNNKTGQYFDTEIPKFDDILDMVDHRTHLENKAKEIETKQKAYQKQQADLKEQSDNKPLPTVDNN